MAEIGIKVYPDNVNEVSKLDADYFEATVRGSYAENEKNIVPATDISVYEKIKGRIIGIHGSILSQGVNLMNRSRNTKLNIPSIENAVEAADRFANCRYVVFHPGYFESGRLGEYCSLENLYNLMRKIDDPRIVLEVVPVFAYNERFVFPVHSVEDYKKLKDKTRKNIILDIGHAMITARAMRYDPIDYIGRLMEELDIKIMHIADNDERKDGYEDSHLHIGEGNVPIEQILRQFKDQIEFATLEVNGVNPKDIELVTSWLQKVHNL